MFSCEKGPPGESTAPPPHTIQAPQCSQQASYTAGPPVTLPANSRVLDTVERHLLPSCSLPDAALGWCVCLLLAGTQRDLPNRPLVPGVLLQASGEQTGSNSCQTTAVFALSRAEISKSNRVTHPAHKVLRLPHTRARFASPRFRITVFAQAHSGAPVISRARSSLPPPAWPGQKLGACLFAPWLAGLDQPGGS